MILSRTMREVDYDELKDEGQVIQDVQKAIEMWYPYQHHHRLWEYTMAQKALNENFGDRKALGGPWPLTVSDHGCGAGYLSPIMYWLGHNVWMYECWTFGNEEKYMLEQMRRVGLKRPNTGGGYEMRNRPLCELTDEDRYVDAAFCISTIEHIGEYQRAFRDLLSTVKPGGIAMITSDFAEDEKDHYQYANLRAGKMFNKDTYEELYQIARGLDFAAVSGGQTDWVWDESCRLTNDYGFASMVVRRNG